MHEESAAAVVVEGSLGVTRPGRAATGPGHIGAQLEGVHKEATEVREVLGALEERLAPVLSAEPADGQGESLREVAPTGESGVAQSLRELGALVREQHSRVRDLLERLEL